MRAMMKSWREASSSRASTLLVSTWTLISMRGIALADAADRRNRQLDRRRGDRAEEDRAALARLQVRDFAVDLAHFEQHAAGPARQRLAVGRQPDAARQPLAERRRARMSSISAIMREAAGCEMFSTWAAALIWPCSSSATIMRMCGASGRCAAACRPPRHRAPASDRRGISMPVALLRHPDALLRPVYQNQHIMRMTMHLTVISIESNVRRRGHARWRRPVARIGGGTRPRTHWEATESECA